MTDNTEPDTEEIRARLLKRLGELERLAEAGSEGRAPVELDQASIGRLSRMDAIQGQAMALETQRRRDVERQRIEQALKRLDEGEYGYCIKCGEEIQPKRLSLDPAIPTCVDCAG